MAQNQKKADVSKKMTKADLITEMADEMQCERKMAAAALEALQTIVERTVSGGGALMLPGIGKISCRERAERMVRNPQTQEMIKKPADKAVKVTIAKSLKDVVNT